MPPALILPTGSNIHEPMKPDCRLPADDPDLARLMKLHDEDFGRRVELAQALARQAGGEGRGPGRRAAKGRAGG